MSANEDDVGEALKLIHPSLLPLLLREQDVASLRSLKLRVRKLPKVAANVCKLASLLVQAYWCSAKVNELHESVSEELDDILKHVWKGLQKHDTGLAISILTKVATTSPKSSDLSQFVGHTDVIHKWNRLFTSRLYAYRDYTKELRTENWPALFRLLVKELRVLGSTAYLDGKFIFPGDKKISEFPFIRRTSSGDGVLYLYSFERVDTNPRLVFESPFSNYTIRIDVDEDEATRNYYNVLRRRLGFDDLSEGIIHLFGNGYRHLQNLATAIALAPGEDAQKAYKELETNYADDVNWFGDIDVKRRKADFVVMLLAAQGPSKVLKEILGNPKFRVFDDYLTYLEPLVEGHRAEWMAAFNQQVAQRENQLAGYLSIDQEKKREISNEIDLETRCWCLLKAAGFAIGSPRPYVESIDMRIELVRDWRQRFLNRELDVNLVGVKIEKLVERTFKFLICFYSGLEGYLRAGKRNRGNRNEHEQSMLAEAKKTIERVWKAAPGPLLGEFRAKLPEAGEIVDEVAEYASLARASDENEEGVAYPLLGRKQICNTKAFENLTSDTYVSVFNRIKHDLLYGPKKRHEVTNNEMERFLDQTIRLFEFLRTGNDDMGRRDGYSLEPVYPMVISFQEAHRNRDGLMIYGYEIYSLNKMRAPKIRILTLHEYAQNEEYYCIPFYNRSTAKWWLDPFLIRCSEFDSVLMGNNEGLAISTSFPPDTHLQI